MTTNYEPRIYVACLASYNNGRLHGTWIDIAGKSSDEIQDEINEKVLRNSPCPNTVFTDDDGNEKPTAEEYAIHDFEGFGKIKLSEYESLDKLVELAEALEEHGEAFELFYAEYGPHARSKEDRSTAALNLFPHLETYG